VGVYRCGRKKDEKIGGDGGANDDDNNDTLDCCKSSLTLSCVSDSGQEIAER
jgi:hypothetical protein